MTGESAAAGSPQGAPPPRPQVPRAGDARVGDPRLRQIRAFIQQAENEPFDIVKAVKMGLRGRMPIVLAMGVFLGTCIAAFLGLTLKPVFQSQGVMRLAARDQSILYNNMDDSRLRLFDAFTMGETNFITSRQVLDRAFVLANKRGLKNLPRDGSSLEAALEVKGQKGLITIAAINGNPETAAGIVNAVLDGYNEVHAEQIWERQDFRERELANRNQELFGKVRELDQKILDIGGEFGASSIAKAHNEKLVQIEEISTRIADMETTVAAIDSRDPGAGAARLSRELAKTIANDATIGMLTMERLKKITERDALSRRYGPESARMKVVLAEIAVVERAMAERQKKIELLAAGTSGDDELKVDGKSPDELRNLLGKLKERRAAYQAEAKELNSRSVELSFLEEERKQTRELLDESRKALEEVRLERRNMAMGPAEIIERGAVPVGPYQDKRKQLMAVGFVGGFGSSMILFIILGASRPRIRYVDEAKALSKGAAFAGELDPKTLGGIHKLRNNLQLALGENSGRGRSIAVVALHPEANAGPVAEALSRSFADAGTQTVIIDADLKTPKLTFSFGHAELTGLRDFIAGGTLPEKGLGAVRSGSIDVLPTGRADVDDDSLSLVQVRQLIETASHTHELAIIDCGESEARLAASLFAAEADIVVGVFCGHAKEGDVKLSVSRLNAVTMRQVHTVFLPAIQARSPVMEWVGKHSPVIIRSYRKAERLVIRASLAAKKIRNLRRGRK